MFTKSTKKSIATLLAMLVMTVSLSAPEDLSDYEYMDDFEYVSDYDDFDGDVDFSDYADCEEE